MIVKHYLVTLLFSVISLGAKSQISNCQNIYVWEFRDENDKTTDVTKDLTNTIEEALVDIRECSVVQRRNLADLQSQLQNESIVQSSREIKSNIKQRLNTVGAENVVFGVLTAVSKKEFELRVRIENIATTKLLRVKSIELDILDLLDKPRKSAKIEELVRKLLDIQDVSASVKKDKSDISDVTKPSSKKSDTVKLTSCMDGYSFEVLSCSGDVSTQTVSMVIDIKHNLPNQKFFLNGRKSRAYGGSTEFDLAKIKIGNNEKGGGYNVSNVIPTDISMTSVITFRNVLKSVNKFDNVSLNILTNNNDGGGNKKDCQLEIANIPISW